MARKTTEKRFSTVPPTVAVKKSPTETETAKAQSSKSAEATAKTTTVVSAEIPAAVLQKATEGTPTVQKASAVHSDAASTKPSKDLAPLIVALHNADADIAREAAVSLGQSGNKAAVEPLMEALGNQDGYFHSVVRAAAASGLGELHDVRAFDTLVSAMNDPMAETSAEAVRALANLGDTRAIQPLIDVVRNADGFFLPVVRRAAVIALKKMGGTQAVAELSAVAACTWEDAVIRQDAGHIVSAAD